MIPVVVSYLRLGDLARNEDQIRHATDLLTMQRRPTQPWFAETAAVGFGQERGVRTYLLASTLTDGEAHHLQRDAQTALAPFQAADTFTTKGRALQESASVQTAAHRRSARLRSVHLIAMHEASGRRRTPQDGLLTHA